MRVLVLADIDHLRARRQEANRHQPLCPPLKEDVVWNHNGSAPMGAKEVR